MPRIALLCSGLGRVHRGHEVFARDLYTLLGAEIDMTLFKGGGEPRPREHVVDHVPRDAACLDDMQLAVSPKWLHAAKEQERMRVEGETFAYAALKPLLEGNFDIIHCLEQEVCNVIYAHRHLFRRTPAVVFSNGGAIPARDLPQCDYVQEHSDHNLAHSAKGKAFMIPHGVDTQRFHPGVATDFRARHGIPESALLVLSVGSICYHHKRMDYVVREVAALDDAWLVIVGQETRDSAAIKALGQSLMGQRALFTTLPHDELPQAYAAADVFTLGSLFETFGIVYIEALAMGLPVICTNHVNQRSIVKEGLFIDMKRPGELTRALARSDPGMLVELGRRGREVALRHYSLDTLQRRYIERYRAIAAPRIELPGYTFRRRLASNLENAVKRTARLIYGRAE